MNKKDVILDYYKGNLAYLYFLLYLIDNGDEKATSYILKIKE